MPTPKKPVAKPTKKAAPVAKKTAPAPKKTATKKRLDWATPDKLVMPGKKVTPQKTNKEDPSMTLQKKLWKKYKGDLTKVPGYNSRKTQ